MDLLLTITDVKPAKKPLYDISGLRGCLLTYVSAVPPLHNMFLYSIAVFPNSLQRAIEHIRDVFFAVGPVPIPSRPENSYADAIDIAKLFLVHHQQDYPGFRPMIPGTILANTERQNVVTAVLIRLAPTKDTPPTPPVVGFGGNRREFF